MNFLGNVPQTLKGSILLVPTISTGWIAQATLDLLIKTYNTPRIGVFEDPAILPVVCVYSPGTRIATALELFHEQNMNLTIIQHRSAPAQVCPDDPTFSFHRCSRSFVYLGPLPRFFV